MKKDLIASIQEIKNTLKDMPFTELRIPIQTWQAFTASIWELEAIEELHQEVLQLSERVAKLENKAGV